LEIKNATIVAFFLFGLIEYYLISSTNDQYKAVQSQQCRQIQAWSQVENVTELVNSIKAEVIVRKNVENNYR